MYKDKKIICIIPARGGSKRLPGKNIKPLNGKPLIGYGIAAAKASQYVDKVVVSTDDEAIARVAKEEGADVPFMRPTELANDTAPTLPVLQHAMKYFEDKGETFDLMVLIQPTVPGIEAKDVDAAIEQLFTADANSCVSICEIIDRPEWMYRLSAGERITPYVENAPARSQDMEELYHLNGAVYVTSRTVLMEKGKIYDNDNCTYIIMPRERSIDIDTEYDFSLAEMLVKMQGNL